MLTEKGRRILLLISLLILTIMYSSALIVGGIVIISAIFHIPKWISAIIWASIQFAVMPFFLWIEDNL